MSAIVWFYRDLRLGDHPALSAAGARHELVIPVFILDEETDNHWSIGAASRWWLHHSLQRLDGSLRERGSRLIIRRGHPLHVLKTLARESGAEAVYWCRRYEPDIRIRDQHISSALSKDGLAVHVTGGSLLFEPDAVSNQSGEPYRVFTPFWKALLGQSGMIGEPEPAPGDLSGVDSALVSESMESLALQPAVPWDVGLKENWTPGETGAQERIEAFLAGGAQAYAQTRDRADLPGSSRMSPHLAWGEISPRQIWWLVKQAQAGAGGESYLREVGWREFSYHLLWHFPETTNRPLDPRFEDFEWREDKTALEAWQRGLTGIPMVDAGMRELWQTGWMHNRLRMVVASFLTKNLLIPWQKGSRWFWDTLVDADLANNTQGWQWTAGCGADAAPYFRIFNPVKQAEKADPEGDYVRRWIPELSRLPDKHLQQPWKAPVKVLEEAGVKLGQDYPEPIVDLLVTRRRALERFDHIKKPQAKR